MKANSLLLLFLLAYVLLPTPAHSQDWLWGKTNTGGEAWAIAADHSGNIFAAAVNYSSYASTWLKYDNSGNLSWSGSTVSGHTWLNNITCDPSGNLIVFGSFSSATMQIGTFTLTNTLTVGTYQYFLAKISPAGTVLWAVCDGNCAGGVSGLGISGVLIDGCGGVTTDNAGNIYITAGYKLRTINIGSHTLTNSDTSGNSYDIFVAKYSPSGAVVWASSIGGKNSDFGTGITVASTGSVYICGEFLSDTLTVGTTILPNPYTSSSASLAFIAKFSSSGSPLWGECGGGYDGAYASSLDKDSHDNIYMTGSFSDLSISFGSSTITRTYPAAAPQYAQYLVKFSPTNTVEWGKTIGSASMGVTGYDVAVGQCGRVWVCGGYQQDANIDGHTLGLVTSGLSFIDPLFVAGYDSSGTVVGYNGLCSGGDDKCGIACDPNGNVFVCGDYYSWVVVGPDTLSTGYSTEGQYIAKDSITPCVPTLLPEYHRRNVVIFPNPTDDELTIKLDDAAYESFSIYNCMGQVLMQQKINSPTTNVSTRSLTAGIYYIVLTGDAGTKVEQIEKM